MRLNARAANAQFSPTMAGAQATCLHPDPIDLTVGEPEGPVPLEIREAAARAALEGWTRYGPAAGLPALREALAADLTARDGVPRDPGQILVTAGGKPAILDALRCILEPGDEVGVFAPYWPTFLDQTRWAGGTPVVVPAGPDLLPVAGSLASRLGPRTRAVILNMPANPTGRVWDAGRLNELADLLLERDAWLIVDQVYGTLSLDGPEVPFLRRRPDLADRTFVVESFSKRFAMTGYRLGAVAGPAEAIRAMTALASTTVTHPCMISQYAGITALQMPGAWETEVKAGLRLRRDRCLEALARIPGVTCRKPEGAIYLLPDFRAWMAEHGVPDDASLAGILRNEAGVKTLPGTPFGAPGHLRLSIAAPLPSLSKAMDRLVERLGGRSQDA